jgi:hypothetical protein
MRFGASLVSRRRSCGGNEQDSGSADRSPVGSLSSLVVNSIYEGDKLMNTSKCPVCDWAINDGGIKVTVAGKEITVCCDECAEKVREEPAKYAAA